MDLSEAGRKIQQQVLSRFAVIEISEPGLKPGEGREDNGLSGLAHWSVSGSEGSSRLAPFLETDFGQAVQNKGQENCGSGQDPNRMNQETRSLRSKRGRRDSNPQPLDRQSSALTN